MKCLVVGYFCRVSSLVGLLCILGICHGFSGHGELVEDESSSTAASKMREMITRKPYAFEADTAGLIQMSNSTMEELQLSLLKYETQLNFNTLDTLLPDLEGIRKNMTALVQSPPSSDHVSQYQDQSSALQSKLIEIEAQIQKNRELLHEYGQIQENAQQQFQVVKTSLKKFLTRQIIILDNKPARPQVGLSDAMEEYLSQALDTQAFGGLHDYLKQLQTPQDRLSAYTYLLNNGFQNLSVNPILVNFAGDLDSHVELHELKTQLPESIFRIFGTSRICLEPKVSYKQLGLSVYGNAFTLASRGRDSSLFWKFYPVENSRYFFLVEASGSVEKAVGDVGGEVHTAPYSGVKTNEKYQWEIKTVNKDSSMYYRLHNVGSNLALYTDGSSVSLADAYYCTDNCLWEIHGPTS